MAASVGVASIAGSESTAFAYLIICNVWIPVTIGLPLQSPANSVNLIGIVLLSLNALTGFAKLPPFPPSTEPPIGAMHLPDAGGEYDVAWDEFGLGENVGWALALT